LLGFMEQQPLYNAANWSIACFNSTSGDMANSTVTSTRLNVFLCPSCTPPSWNMLGEVFTAMAPGNSYFSSFGSSLEFTASQSGGPPNGPFTYVPTGPCTRIASIQDGTSNTIAFGEWKIGTGNNSVVTIPQDIVYIGSYPPGVTRDTPQMSMPMGGAALLQWMPQCAAAAGTKRQTRTPTLGEDWAFGLVSYSMGNVLLAPNPKYPNCSVNPNGVTDWPGVYTLSSFHPGGANVLMCDGSVRFLKDSTDLMTIWALGSMAQGEVISADAF
jgi:prepilin-type processing-associated H-X9-DG protein